MRRAITTVSVLAMLAAVSGPGQAQQDPLLGTWKQNLAKSQYDPSTRAPQIPTTVRRTAVGTNGYKQTTEGMDAQGAVTHTEFTAFWEGKDYPVAGSPDYESVSLKKIDAFTLITVNKRNGVVVRMLRTVVSQNGKTSTSAVIGYTAQGIAFHNVVVLDKQ
jgi:hypothetical protein